jgi:hypothetical protein
VSSPFGAYVVVEEIEQRATIAMLRRKAEGVLEKLSWIENLEFSSPTNNRRGEFLALGEACFDPMSRS